jgi:hypothetical protein
MMKFNELSRPPSMRQPFLSSSLRRINSEASPRRYRRHTPALQTPCEPPGEATNGNTDVTSAHDWPSEHTVAEFLLWSIPLNSLFLQHHLRISLICPDCPPLLRVRSSMPAVAFSLHTKCSAARNRLSNASLCLLVMIMGLHAQMVMWRNELGERLADAGEVYWEPRDSWKN